MNGEKRQRSEGRVKACTECRQQKLRCDARDYGYSKPCSRCSKLHLDCVVSTNFKRRKKQTKAQLQEEIQRLRSHVKPPEEIRLSDIRPSNLDGATSACWTSPDHATPFSGHVQAPPISVSPNLQVPSDAVGAEAIDSNDYLTRMAPRQDSFLDTRSQSLEGQEIDARRINDCFSLFFRNYASLLPIVELDTSPNLCYSQSHVLFWTIITVGSRRYPADPTLLGRLASCVTNLALSSLSSRSSPLQLIQALLILCTWPMPINTMSKDISHVLAGAAMHLAMQIGLHIFGIGQEFARTQLNPDDSMRAFRAKLWMYCLVVCQSVCLIDGLPPPVVVDSREFEQDRKQMLEVLSADAQYQFQLHTVQINAAVAMMKSSSSVDSSAQTSVLQPLIEIFDDQLTDLRPEVSNPLNEIYLRSARMHVQAFYFFADSRKQNLVGLTKLFAVACLLIDSVVGLDIADQMAVSTFYLSRTLLLAAFTILKISRSEQLAAFLDLDRGEAAYFAIINMFKGMSLENDDLASRSATILAQLWRSQKIFRRPDGTLDGLSLRIRSRLAMSVIFDCLWWWREEFAGVKNPFSTEKVDQRKTQGEGFLPVTSPPRDDERLSPAGDSLFLVEEPFPDFDWAASLDFPLEELALPGSHLGST